MLNNHETECETENREIPRELGEKLTTRIDLNKEKFFQLTPINFVQRRLKSYFSLT